jgi:hypothetical protein
VKTGAGPRVIAPGLPGALRAADPRPAGAVALSFAGGVAKIRIGGLAATLAKQLEIRQGSAARIRAVAGGNADET